MANAVLQAAPGETPVAGQRPYKAYGAAERLLYCQDREVMLDGPANTGKSRACLEKLHICATNVPNLRALIVRKTRSSLTESALVTFEAKVLPENSSIRSGPNREQRHSYKYSNGAEIVIGGLGDAAEKTRVMSTEYDLIYVQEARETLEGEWEDLTTRLRNHVLEFQQIIGDTNPDAPSHWIKRRSARGLLTLLPSRHEDNPAVTSEDLATLDALSGVRYKRLRLGLWVAAEGIVYEDYDPAVHLIDRFPIPADWPRYRVVDFGYSNPFVCQWWAEDPDGRLYRYRELYHTRQLVEDMARQIKDLSEGERIVKTICDHDAEGRATLERHAACSTTPAFKDVTSGIQVTQKRFTPAGDGKPRIYLLRDSLIGRDSSLDERKLPASTEEEIEAYVWPPETTRNPEKREAPVKEDDHGMDAMRYMVAEKDIRGVASAGLKVLTGSPAAVSTGGQAPPKSRGALDMLMGVKG